LPWAIERVILAARLWEVTLWYIFTQAGNYCPLFVPNGSAMGALICCFRPRSLILRLAFFLLYFLRATDSAGRPVECRPK